LWHPEISRTTQTSKFSPSLYGKHKQLEIFETSYSETKEKRNTHLIAGFVDFFVKFG